MQKYYCDICGKLVVQWSGNVQLFWKLPSNGPIRIIKQEYNDLCLECGTKIINYCQSLVENEKKKKV